MSSIYLDFGGVLVRPGLGYLIPLMTERFRNISLLLNIQPIKSLSN